MKYSQKETLPTLIVKILTMIGVRIVFFISISKYTVDCQRNIVNYLLSALLVTNQCERQNYKKHFRNLGCGYILICVV